MRDGNKLTLALHIKSAYPQQNQFIKVYTLIKLSYLRQGIMNQI